MASLDTSCALASQIGQFSFNTSLIQAFNTSLIQANSTLVAVTIKVSSSYRGWSQLMPSAQLSLEFHISVFIRKFSKSLAVMMTDIAFGISVMWGCHFVSVTEEAFIHIAYPFPIGIFHEGDVSEENPPHLPCVDYLIKGFTWRKGKNELVKHLGLFPHFQNVWSGEKTNSEEREGKWRVVWKFQKIIKLGLLVS